MDEDVFISTLSEKELSDLLEALEEDEEGDDKCK